MSALWGTLADVGLGTLALALFAGAVYIIGWLLPDEEES